MLILYIIVIGVMVGGLASHRNSRSALLYVPLAILGALMGAFATFGDASFLLRNQFFNPFTMPPLASAIIVGIAYVWKNRKKPNV